MRPPRLHPRSRDGPRASFHVDLIPSRFDGFDLAGRGQYHELEGQLRGARATGVPDGPDGVSYGGMRDGLVMLAFGLRREIGLQGGAGRVVRSMPLGDCPIEDFLDTLPDAGRKHWLRQPDRAEDRRQVTRGNRGNRKMPDRRLGNASYFIDPLLALTRPPRRRMDRVNGLRRILEARDRGDCLVTRIAAGARDLPVREGHLARFGQ